MSRSYPPWRQSYSFEDFDRAQQLATEWTDEDRAAGRPAPAGGYSREHFRLADTLVRRAKR